MRGLVAALVLVAGLGAAPALGGASPCGVEQAELLRLFSETDGASSRALAEAARDVVDACSADASAVEPRAMTAADRTLAEACGFEGTATGGAGDAPILGVVQVLFKSIVERDQGPAVVAYHPESGLVAYAAVGTATGNWSFAATSAGAGVVTWHGVPFEAAPRTGLASAKAGCGVPPTPEICWGEGSVVAPIPGIGAIHASGEYWDC